MRLRCTYADWGCERHWCADYSHCNLGIIEKWVAVQKFQEEIGSKITKIPYKFFKSVLENGYQKTYFENSFKVIVQVFKCVFRFEKKTL